MVPTIVRRVWALNGQTSDLSAPLFRRIRWQLTAWYIAFLAILLLIVGVVLYQGMQSKLLDPVDNNLAQSIQGAAATWQSGSLFSFCDTGTDSLRGSLWACYAPNGQLASQDRLTAYVPRFLDPDIVREAMISGKAADTIDTHTNFFGIVRRYAVLVIDRPTGTVLGILVVGQSIGDRVTALHMLLTLLLICGALGLVAAGVSGFYLAHRSLRPIRLAYQRQSDFIADASHELRTPLTIARADAEVLLRDKQHLDEDQELILTDLVAEIGHMTALTGNMLDLARLEAGRLQLEEDVVDLGRLVRDVARRAERLAGERRVRIAAAGDESVLVVADPTLLEHVLLILVDNAIKYNRLDGDVVLSVRQEGGQAVVQVQDTGIGIPAEDLPHVGERFYRVDKARSRAEGGSGLGISIARAIAVRHGGALEISSEQGEGTTVTLRLPAAQRVEQPAVSA